MSSIEKLNFLAGNVLTYEFIDFTYEINKNPWCQHEETHKETWCNGACTAIKFLKPIMEIFKKTTFLKKK